MAAHCEPTYYEDGRLTITVRSSAWASRLRQQQAELMQTLKQQSAFRELRDIKVRVQPTEQALLAVSTAPDVPPSRLSSNAARVVRDVAQTVNDPQLRAALERLGDIVGEKK